jgi:hypothetical protein
MDSDRLCSFVASCALSVSGSNYADVIGAEVYRQHLAKTIRCDFQRQKSSRLPATLFLKQQCWESDLRLRQMRLVLGRKSLQGRP